MKGLEGGRRRKICRYLAMAVKIEEENECSG
jgi:hypothetical protein